MPILNPEQIFESMKGRVAEALRAQFPFEGAKRRLELVDVKFDEKATAPDDQHHIDNLDAQFKARTEGGTWGVPIRARLRLIDKETGHAIEEQTITLARLPKLTRRYSYIIDGQERQHDSVFRSKPRPYHRIAANGAIQGRWNLARGRQFDINYEPKNAHMSMRVGTSNIPLYPVLRALGVADASMENAWGKVVYEANRRTTKMDRDIDKLFKALALRMADHSTGGSTDQKAARIRTYFTDETEVWPDAMKSAFGKPYTHVNGENLLLSSQRLIDIQKGRLKEDPRSHELPDDRQSLSSKYLATTEDFLVEAIRHAEGDLRKKVADRIDKLELRIDDILSPNTYNKVILGKFSNAQRPDQTNPLQFLSGYMRTTIRGKDFGGVGSEKINLDPDKRINPTHLGFLDPIQTPESEDTGIALHLPLGIDIERAAAIPGSRSRVSSGQDLKIKVYDRKTDTTVSVTPADLEHEIVAYPDQVKWFGGKPSPVAAEVVCYDEERKTSKRPWARVRYVLPSAKALFSFSANLVPFLQNNSGNRAMTGTKQQEQAVALVHREEPLVQVKTDRAVTFEKVMGTFAAHFAPVAGTVAQVEPGAVHVDTGKGKHVRVPVYNHYPLNGGRNELHAHPVVKVGDQVEKGGLIADTNFTKNGTLAMGSNMRVAYVPWKGLNFEDGIVVSESAAKRMASSHMHQLEITIYPGMVGGSDGDRAKWVDYSTPERTASTRMSKLDGRGIVKEGTIVTEGDVLVAALSPTQPTAEDAIVSRIHKSLAKPFRDSSLAWDHEYRGRVVKVIFTEGLNRKNITVHVATEEPLVVGDKLTGRHGNKGIVSRIVPDHQMPRSADGAHVEMLLNPAGVPSRMNVGQVLETAASKVAEKTGKPYVVENFVPGVDYSDRVKKDLKEHGLSDTEELFDPETKRSIGQILTGKQYMFKLHHMVEKKMTARSMLTGYTSSGDAPSGSGIPGGGQKMDMLTTYAMLAHGARNNLREAYTFKSDGDQDAVWAAVMTGRALPPPQPTRGMKNFLDYLRALGVNTEKKGDEYTIMPMTDAHLLGDPKRNFVGISNGEIKLPEKMAVARGARTIEETGGLFDPKVTGGLKGQFWSHVKLAERMPNPLFESAIQVLTGTTKRQYDLLVSDHLPEGGKSGFHTIVDKLRAIDVDKELAKERARVGSLSRGELSASVKKIRYLEALKEHRLTPVEAYTNQYLPVLPPSVRRISINLDGTQMLDDRNGLYLAVGHANGALKEADPSTPPSDLQKARAHLYDSLRALKIEGMTQTAGKPRHLAGLMELLSGKTDGSGAPKNSYFQNGVLSRRQDLSGRSTIVPEPALHLDEVGIPIPVATEMYRPFIVQELHREGMDAAAADKLVRTKKDDPHVLSALERAIEHRPVMLKRDPSLHKFSIMAFKPKLVEGKAIKIHPLVTGGFNADFDGDTMALYVPVSPEAVDEAKKMMPSQNLFSPTHYGLMPVPGQDSLLGIYQATKWGADATHPPGLTREKAVEMMGSGKLKPTDVVVIDGKKTTPGRVALALHLPAAMQHDEKLLHDPSFMLDKGNLQAVLTRVGKDHEKAFPHVVDAWKDIGNKLSYLNGSSFSIDDFHDGKQFRDYTLDKYRVREAQLHKTPMSGPRRDREIVKIWTEARKELEEHGKKRYNAGENRVWEWARAKARGNWEQFSQLVFGPMLVQDASKKDVPVPITKSYGEGLSVSEYWASMHGARKGTLDRVQGTREPGAVTKDIINTVMGMHVTAEDCGATDGVKLSPKDPDALDRYLARQVKAGGEVLEAGHLLTPVLATKLTNAGVEQIVLRSPLYCRMSNGICQRCYGKNERGHHHAIGTNIGIIAGHALGEPITQLTMKTFHCLHQDSLVLVRRGERIFHTTMGALFHAAPGGVVEDGEERRSVGDLEIWDLDGWVKVRSARRHLQEPGTEMVFARTRSGYGIISQDNHPHMLVENTAVCPRCNTYPKKSHEQWYCRKCDWKWDGVPGANETFGMVAPQEITRLSHAAGVDVGPGPTSSTPPLAQGWLAGMYCAEGSIHAQYVKTSDYKVGVTFSQNAGSGIYDRIGEALLTEYGERTLGRTPKGYQLYGRELAEHYEAAFGRYSRSKALPEGWSGFPHEWLLDFVSGVIDGDGTFVSNDDSQWKVCRIDTTSFALAQQLHWILRGVGVHARVILTPQRKISRHQPFAVTFALTRHAKNLLSASSKVREQPGRPRGNEERFGSVIDYVAPVFFASPPYVYDLETESGTLYVDGFWTHNTGGASGSGASAVDSFQRVKQLFDLPEKLADSATLAEVSGQVEKITHEPAIGYIVIIAGKEHRVVTGHLLPEIKVGHSVHRGDPISTGPINPHELLQHTKSVGRVRDYMTNELMAKDLYGGLGVRRRNVETVVKGMTNLSEVHDAPEKSPFMRGQLIPLSEIEAYNAEAEAAGHETVKHAPRLKPMDQAPLAGVEDWLARLNYQRLKETYTEGAQQGWKSNVTSHPIAGLAHGAEFGLHPMRPLKPPPKKNGARS